ncbi:MAG: mechanosensitive ion channel family protein [Armatimonadota bacterium]
MHFTLDKIYNKIEQLYSDITTESVFLSIFLFPVITFLVLSLIYNIIFKKLRMRNFSLKYLFDKIRILAYFYVILIPLLMIAINWPDAYFGDFLFRTFYYLTILVTVILVIEVVLTLFFDLFIVKKQKTGVPYLFKDLVKFTLYFILFMVILGEALELNLQTLLTTSAVFSIILGLALQDTLGNLFSGLAMHLSKPYSIGDWIQVGDNTGKVEKIDWRSTTIKTFTDDYLTIPNSNISKVEIENFSTPSIVHARHIEVGVHYRYAPNKVKKSILKSVLETEGVLHDPFPKIFLEEFGDFSVKYKVRLWIDNFASHRAIESQAKERIWYRFKRDGIEIPFPIRNVYQHKVETYEERLDNIVNILKMVDFLRELSENDLLALASKVKHQIFAAGEVIFNQGASGKTFYIITSGHMQVTVKNKCGEVVLVREMGQYDFFGEMSLLTGDPRSATVSAIEDCEVLVLDKEDLRELLEKNENVRDGISKILAERQIRTQKSIEECSLEEEEEMIDSKTPGAFEILHKQILKKITDFFSM